MRGILLHLVALWACLGLLTACEPSWNSQVPVGRAGDGPLQVQRPVTVTVYAGDTVYSIARRYSLSVRELIEANNLQPPYQLVAGTALRLPGGAASYVVQKGDTLSVLARHFKLDFNTFAATNNKKPPYVLRVGERLTLSGGHGGTTTVAAASPGGTPGPLVVTSPNAGPQPGTGASVRKGGPPPGSEPAPAAPSAQVAAAPSAGPAMTAAVPPPPSSRAGSTFLWPVKGEVLAEFGPLANKGQHNDGINIAAPKGTPVRAAENGTVAYVGNELRGFGNLLLIKHADGWITAYAHNDHLMVKRGERVRRGQTIATVGSSGSVTVPQLHFEIRHGTEAVNPMDYLHDTMAKADLP